MGKPLYSLNMVFCEAALVVCIIVGSIGLILTPAAAKGPSVYRGPTTHQMATAIRNLENRVVRLERRIRKLEK